MKTILFLLLLCVALNAHGATYMLLSQTNTFANNITKNATNAANAFTIAHTNFEYFSSIEGVVSNTLQAGGIELLGLTDGSASLKGTFPIGTNDYNGISFAVDNGLPAESYPSAFYYTVTGQYPDYVDAIKISMRQNPGTNVGPSVGNFVSGINSGVYNFNYPADPPVGCGVGVAGFAQDSFALAIGLYGQSQITHDFGTGYGLLAQCVYWPGGTNVGVGVFFDQLTGSVPFAENAGVLVQTTNNIPIFVGLDGSNKVMSILHDGSITTGGNTNRWIFGGVTNGAPDVSVDGTHYPLAPLASPALTGTPTINGQSVEGELTNKVAKAGGTMSGPLSFSGTTQPGVQLNNLTTTQRDALAGVNTNSGSLLWNTTQQRMNVHNGSAWTDGFVRYAGDTGVGALGITPAANTTGLTVSGFSQTATNTAALLDLSGTWNNGTATNTAIKVNVTDTASGAGSYFALFSSNTVPVFSVAKNGSIGTVADISGQKFRTYNTQLAINSGYNLALEGTGGLLEWNYDTILLRDAANTLAMRNGANAQAIRLYNTYTDASNYERLFIGCTGAAVWFAPQKAGTGVMRDTYLGGGTMYLQSGDPLTTRWNVSSSGHLLAGADNTYDIGASGATRPRNVYVASDIGANGAGARNIFAASGGAGQGFWVYSTAAGITVDANTHLQLKSTGDLVQFGGSTASFAALKRNGDNLEVRLADDSNYASLALRNLKGGSTKVLTSAAAADFLYVSVPNTNAIGGDVIWEVVATDGTETQSQTGRTRFDAVAKSTTVTAGLNTMTNNAVVTAGTLTVGIASNVTTNNVWALGATATTSLTTTNLTIKWRLETPSTFTINSL